MRRRIRLTGRKQLSKADALVKVIDVSGKRMLTLALGDAVRLAKFAKDSRVVVVLKENKLIELVEFGTLGALRQTAELTNTAFANPTCQLRIVSPDGQHRGLLLGSTDAWTLNAITDEHERGKKGILCFQPDDIAPRAWKLEIRDDDYPVVYVDSRIPDVRTWVRTDPVFIGFVFPAIVAQVFDDILLQLSEPEMDWMKGWLSWANVLMPGNRPPYGGTSSEKKEWIELLIDSFSYRHRLSDRLVRQLAAEGAHT